MATVQVRGDGAWVKVAVGEVEPYGHESEELRMTPMF